MWVRVFIAGMTLAHLAFATPGVAGLSADVADCKAAKRADACTRLLVARMVRADQLYIAYYNRGWAHRQAGQNDQALGDFERAVRLNPKFALGLYSRALLLHERGRRNEAVADLSKALRIENNFTAAHTLLGRIAEANGDTAEARRHYERAVAKSATLFNGESAFTLARQRLEAIGSTQSTAAQASKPTKMTACSRYVAAANQTVEVPCE